MTTPFAPLPGPSGDAPRRRHLRTFAFDPMSTRLSGEFLTISVPFEPDLERGPRGVLLEVVDYDPVRKLWYKQIDLNETFILLQDGLTPAEADPRSHQQIVYAVAASVIERFERYLGRRFRWRDKGRLALVPHAFEGRNAFFDPEREAVLFGYYRADSVDPGANLPEQMIFTCLSNDIIAHEVTHGIVHRLRPHFAEATNPEVFAWHEAFADLIALFQHFAHRGVVRAAIASTAGNIERGGALFDLASEFGQSTGRGEALRQAIDPKVPTAQIRTPDRYRAATEPHERGACFVGAVFDAYIDRFQAAVADLLRMARSGAGLYSGGRLHPDLVERVTAEAVMTADRFLGMVVRAFDYLPPVDVTFGDVVRAIVTSDYALYPTDGDRLRGLLVEALRRRGIHPTSVMSLTDSALVWPPGPEGLSLNVGDPSVPLGDLVLDATMKFDPTVDPGEPPREVCSALARWAQAHAIAVGFDPDHEIVVDGVDVAYRQADDCQPRPEVVVQFTQQRPDLEEEIQPDVAADKRTALRAGTTLIAGVDGKVKYVISKPLPLSVKPIGGDEDSTYVHEFGKARLADIKRWFDKAEDADPLSIWTDEPAVHRLNFASLHFNNQTGS